MSSTSSCWTTRFRFNLRPLTVRSRDKDTASLLAFQPASNGKRIAVIPFGLCNGHWSAGDVALLPPVFKPDATKFATDDAWQCDPFKSGSSPVSRVSLASLPDQPWPDPSPALLQNGTHTTLAFYRRADAVLDNTHFSGGNAALVQYDIDGHEIRDKPHPVSQLPVIYSETLWLERLQRMACHSRNPSCFVDAQALG